MSLSPILALHIAGGTVSVLSGGATLCFRKGSRLHRRAGIVFVVAMLTMATCALYLAVAKLQIPNILGGVLTLYFVTTAWLTVKRKEQAPGLFDWGALLFVLTIAATQIALATQAALSASGKKYGYRPAFYFVFGGLALLSAAGDIRMLLGRGLSATQRLARHLWRMCFALFVATGSLFLARPHLFPVFMRKSGMLMVLGFGPLVLMIFWLVRIRFMKTARKPPVPVRDRAYAARPTAATGVMP
jgi:hypothetical protein